MNEEGKRISIYFSANEKYGQHFHKRNLLCKNILKLEIRKIEEKVHKSDQTSDNIHFHFFVIDKT